MFLHGTSPEILCDVMDIRLSREIDTPYKVLSELIFSSRNQCIEVFKFNLKPESKVRIGYMAWMEISKETLVFMLRHGTLCPHYYEWNEGHILYILDVLFSPRHPTMALSSMLERIRKYRVVVFYRRGRLRIYRRRGKKFYKWQEMLQLKSFYREMSSGGDITTISKGGAHDK